MPEPEPTPDPPKRRGRPPGSKNKKATKPKLSIPWFNIWRSVFWAVVSVASIAALYSGVAGLAQRSLALVIVAVVSAPTAFLLDREWKKMWGAKSG